PSQPGRVYRVGYLAPDELSPEPFIQELARLGYAEPENLVVETRLLKYRSSYLMDESRYSDLAAAPIRQQPDVIVTQSTPATRQARTKTNMIPIVMRVGGDPVAAGLVGSLDKPGRNVTGLAGDPSGQLLVKRIALLKAV